MRADMVPAHQRWVPLRSGLSRGCWGRWQGDPQIGRRGGGGASFSAVAADLAAGSGALLHENVLVAEARGGWGEGLVQRAVKGRCFCVRSPVLPSALLGNYLFSLTFHFLFHRMGLVIVPTHRADLRVLGGGVGPAQLHPLQIPNALTSWCLTVFICKISIMTLNSQG